MLRRSGTITVDFEDQHEPGCILVVTGEVDAHTTPCLAGALERTLHEHPARVLVDLSDVLFMDAAGLVALASANASAWPHTVFAVIATGAAARPLQVTGLDSAIAVYPHRSMALACTADALELPDRVARGAAGLFDSALGQPAPVRSA
ncbi:STAS domain-containing protein [Nocardia sp. XZ_19_385]|uniref:STAS domain-containing protein n=1 Tax=Nocardia sp. XZ_19_385 TaxID=2769488 RepID=UPI00188DD485|nr:STAS domain-containing protein [Nocardia sp. XZ_19_385]